LFNYIDIYGTQPVYTIELGCLNFLSLVLAYMFMVQVGGPVAHWLFTNAILIRSLVSYVEMSGHHLLDHVGFIRVLFRSLLN